MRRTRRLRSQLLSPAAVWGGSQATQPRRSLWEEQGTQDPRWGYLAGTEQVQLQQWSQRFHCAEPALLRCSNTVCTAVHHGCTPETGCQQRCRASVPYWVTGAEAQAALRARSAPQFLVALAPPVTTRRVRALRAALAAAAGRVLNYVPDHALLVAAPRRAALSLSGAQPRRGGPHGRRAGTRARRRPHTRMATCSHSLRHHIWRCCVFCKPAWAARPAQKQSRRTWRPAATAPATFPVPRKQP